MRILAIGGTGFLGPYVIRELHNAGHDVTVFHRGEHESALLPAGVRHVRSPLAAIPVTSFPPELKADFDIVIHMIAMGEADARAAVEAFAGRAARMVVLSSGDVYRAYGRFTRLEPGEPDPVPLVEDSPLRSVLCPYRSKAASRDDLNYWYEKILVELTVMGAGEIAGTVLRLPKVYGREQNSDLATVTSFRGSPHWRWTHGYVENVASAVALAAMHPAAGHRIYNVGELHTPTVEERLRSLPSLTGVPQLPPIPDFDFRQDIVYDTRRIRRELGYEERVGYEEGLRRTLCGRSEPAEGPS